ncbi:MAG: integral rane protein [Actinoallomurus sp.]|jgi:hypothetical protein|nr:integral rane protein [Actinoallomurus sp.]
MADESEAHRAEGEASPARRPRRLREVHPTRRGLVLAWWSFTVTFTVLRLLTWVIHLHVSRIGNVHLGGVHIHHYLWGILLLAIVGACGLVERSPAWRVWMGVAYGVGLALVVDEMALLIDLKDVYWQTQGGSSVAVALILIGVGGSVLALTRAPSADTSSRSATGTRRES